jgi:hypothetical protein
MTTNTTAGARRAASNAIRTTSGAPTATTPAWPAWRFAGLFLIAPLIACAAPALPGSAAPAEAQEAGTETMVPPGFGTLKVDDITMSLRAGPLLIKVTPLDERVIRLLAPDSYERLHNMAEQRRANAAAATGSQPAELFMVTFFSYEANVDFQPEDLQAFHRGRLMLPSTILPITPGWGRQRMAQQEQQIAVYVLEGPIDYEQPIRLQYGLSSTDAWTRIIPALEIERTRVRAKAGGGEVEATGVTDSPETGGYAIRLDVEERTDGAMLLGSGTLYEGLQRLEEWGWIEETAGPPVARTLRADGDQPGPAAAYSGMSYSLILRYSVRSPMASISAARRRLPLTSRSAAVIAAFSRSRRVMPER